ncbi:conserved hypothetical protein [Hyella patelloides LEGE 07179]|uniref:Siphovirus Gp157 family protein n=1 Tax=Hyella patelloides LEGE 07179 TaxID=945734 RepID=A0A563W0B2_9CYAN|nr:siphovirus Gp157 family protein [Hyella patelloides]VEP17134.1 conserved hypothetical protein [Hyella patelloides LEGE 07179]
MTQATRLWELSDEIQELETAISLIQEDETLSDGEREIKLEETFNQWLEAGESFKSKAEQVASFIRHQEALAAARKEEAKRIQALAKQAENEANRLRKYLIAQMVRSDVKRIDRVSAKISLRKKQPQVLLNVPTEELPTEYVRVTHKPDLTKIRAKLKADAQGAIGWASLSEQQEYSVTIR